MKARDMIAGASFGPDSVKDLQAAFAQAWDTLAGGFPEEEHEAVRARLARTLLALRSQERLPVDRLCDAALKVIRAQYNPLVTGDQQAPMPRVDRSAPSSR